jgi:bifunctional UDP-N-acetylglucosamine pyrophosphorylase/glucosamine-1-phosphate N-acetyltransferase
VIVLAAGQGTRMKSALPKVLHPVAGRPMINHVLAAAEALDPARIVVVVAPGMESVAAAVAPHATAIQDKPLGTAHAVLAARDALRAELAAGADVLVLYGDGPLISPGTLGAMLAERRRSGGPAFVWLGVRPPDPTGYGRLVMQDGHLARIVEEKDASPEERAVALVWGGLVAGAGPALFELAAKIDDNNAKREFYLTSLVGIGNAAGAPSGVVETAFDEVRGVNSRQELAEAEAILQQRLRRRAMAEGATLVAPETVFLSWDTVLGRDVTIEPHVVFGPGVTVEDGVVIRAFCHLVGVTVRGGAQVGPFARLRPGSEVGEGAHVGNFVELKAARLGAGAKANHLAYVGDASVGAGANIGAGTITANYDGVMKHRTEIGAGAAIGSNTVLVAPVTVGEGAVVGAGSTITQAVPADAIVATRAPMTVTERSAARYRARLKAIKAEKERT